MERCPKCGEWFLSYDPVHQEKVCFNKDCNYREKYPREKYYKENDYLPKLAKSLTLRSF